jgi:hypothetical protein
MKPATRSLRRQSTPNQGSGTHASRERKRTEPRVRVLLFACEGDDAQLMMIYSERMEITYLPSYDMAEVREEIERCKPKLILCEADAFLDVLPAGPSEVSIRPKRNGTPTTAAGARLIYAARTRNGFTPAFRVELFKKLKPLEITQCPFANLPEKKAGRWGAGLTAAKMKECRWLKPVLVGQFEFVEWTEDTHSGTPGSWRCATTKKPSM